MGRGYIDKATRRVRPGRKTAWPWSFVPDPAPLVLGIAAVGRVGAVMSAQDYPPYIDRYDAKVVEQLEEGEIYKVSKIRKGYKRFTSIRADSTAEERMKTLMETPAFECVRPAYFRYLGPVEPEGI
jgi:hypothetical protein